MTLTFVYNQVMNEIMAVIVYAGLSDEESPDNLINHEHIEPDCYTIFTKIMELGIADMFVQKYTRPKLKENSFDDITTIDKSTQTDISEMIRLCLFVYHRIL